MLVDEEARRRITHDGLDELLFVEAGAGTGKTKQLVDRVVALVLARGVPMREIAAITFTEAAASELRARVREAFERTVHDPATPEPTRGQCETALADLDSAAIGTVHSFAQRVLAEHPIEAGLPPFVEVLDEVESLLAFDRRWTEHVDQMFASPELDEVIALASILGVRIDHAKFSSLRDVAVVFSDNWDRIASAARVPVTAPECDASSAVAALDAFLPVLDRCEGMDDSLAEYWREHADAFRSVRAALEHPAARLVVGALSGKPKVRVGNKGKAPSWGGKDGKDAVLALADAVDAACQDVLDQVTDAVLRVLAGEVARFTEAAADARRREGRLEFHDLLVLARRLLRTSPDARDALHRRNSRLLVAELQDTDPIQIELTTLIAASVGGGEPAEDWTEIAVDRERLFFVGDPKQSIYRFRRADIGLFLRARDTFAAEPVRLTTNFRTVEPLVGWVNDVFGRLMAEEVPERRPRYEALAAHRAAGPGDHRVVLLGGPHAKEEGLRAGPLRELEAATVADAVAGILAEPAAWPVEDGSEWRAARPEDVAILVPTRTSLPFLMEALRERGVEYRAETGTLVYETQEVRDLVAILRAVGHGADAIALVAALRSPILGCGDDDLVTYAAAGGGWDLNRPRPDLPPDHPVMAALAFLDELRAARWWCGPGELIERIVAERGAMTIALAAPRARDVWRRVRFLVDQARLFEASQSADLVEFVAWAELQRSDMARVHEPLLPESDDHAVRIMTMHGAKGLEFPITVLSGLTTRIGGRRRGVQVLWAGDEVHVASRKGVETTGFDRRADLEEEMDAEEKLRLLYVGCTRARDHLLVAAHHVVDAKCFAQKVWAESQTADPGRWRQVEVPADRRVEPVSSPAVVPPTDEVDEHAAWLDRRARLVARARTPRTISATAVKRSAVGGVAVAAGADDREGPPAAVVPPTDEVGEDARGAPATARWRVGRAATAFGRAVHAVLQDVDLATGAEVDALARAAATTETLGDDGVDAVAAAVRAVLAAPVVRDAAAAEAPASTGAGARRVFREMYVAGPVGDRVVEGYVDLLVRTEDGLVIVDYKTDRLRGDAALDARAGEYRLQLAAYAAALEAVTGERVAAGVLVFVSEDGAVERRFDRAELGVEDLAGLIAAEPAGA